MSNGAHQSKQGPTVVVLYCQHGISEEAKGSAWSQQTQGLTVRAVMMPCSSKIEVPYVLKLLERQADAVEIVACPEADCKLLTGSLRAEKRVDYIRDLLRRTGLNPECVGISRRLSQTPEELTSIARARAEAARSFGDNPQKTGEQQ